MLPASSAATCALPARLLLPGKLGRLTKVQLAARWPVGGGRCSSPSLSGWRVELTAGPSGGGGFWRPGCRQSHLAAAGGTRGRARRSTPGPARRLDGARLGRQLQPRTGAAFLNSGLGRNSSGDWGRRAQGGRSPWRLGEGRAPIGLAAQLRPRVGQQGRSLPEGCERQFVLGGQRR